MRTLLTAVVAGVLLMAGLQPATAASKPGSVGMVSFVAASLSRSTGKASLTVDWRAASRATSYQVFVSRHYSMKNAKRYSTRHTHKKITRLVRGADYFVQVRAMNRSRAGSKSKRVGHTTIRRLDPAKGPTYRVMTYNLCSEKCSHWADRRQSPAIRRIQAYKPDVLAAQEAVAFRDTPIQGYEEAVYKSSKQIRFRTDRFTVAAPGPFSDKPAPVVANPKDPVTAQTTCDRTWSQSTRGYVYLGFHGKKVLRTQSDGTVVIDKRDSRGCRYAVWAVLQDRRTGHRTVFVSAHTVSGDSTSRARERELEIKILTRHLAEINPSGLPIVYAGDFNSHKHRSNDYLARVFQGAGYYDAFDLAMTLRRQHYNSYNDFSVTPRVSYTWGDHVDHLWLRPSEGRILRWDNGALISGGRMVTPIPSDHSPIVIDLRLNR